MKTMQAVTPSVIKSDLFKDPLLAIPCFYTGSYKADRIPCFTAEQIPALLAAIKPDADGYVPLYFNDNGDLIFDTQFEDDHEERFVTVPRITVVVPNKSEEATTDVFSLKLGSLINGSFIIKALQPATISADFFEDPEAAIPCFTDGETWNGWGVPVFTPEQIPALLAALTPDTDGYVPLYFNDKGEFIFDSQYEDASDEDRYTVIPLTNAYVLYPEGVTQVSVYDLNIGWTFDACKLLDVQ